MGRFPEEVFGLNFSVSDAGQICGRIAGRLCQQWSIGSCLAQGTTKTYDEFSASAVLVLRPKLRASRGDLPWPTTSVVPDQKSFQWIREVGTAQSQSCRHGASVLS